MIVVSDDAAIKRVLFDSDIWDRCLNGHSVTRESFILPRDWVYLTETGDEIFILSGDKIHVNILRNARGNAYFKCIRFIRWIFNNTDLDEIYLKVHVKHKNAIKLAKVCGFRTIEILSNRELMRFKKCQL